jgi:plastocyanin
MTLRWCPVRLPVLLVTMLLVTMALAGCHDLPNTFAPRDEVAAEDGLGGEDGEPGGDDDDEANGGQGNDDGSDGDNGDGGGGDNGDGGDNATGDDPPAVEAGDFAADHTINIEQASAIPGIGSNCQRDPYSPASLSINVGEVVRWVNNGGCVHTATSGDAYNDHDDLFDTGTISVGDHSEKNYRFNEAGTYTYYCKFHQDMGLAEIVVS